MCEVDRTNHATEYIPTATAKKMGAQGEARRPKSRVIAWHAWHTKRARLLYHKEHFDQAANSYKVSTHLVATSSAISPGVQVT